jgi:hypothetical protein
MNKPVSANHETAECNICGEQVCADELSMYSHLLEYHPRELLQSPKVQYFLNQFAQGISDLFEGFGKRLRGM